MNSRFGYCGLQICVRFSLRYSYVERKGADSVKSEGEMQKSVKYMLKVVIIGCNPNKQITHSTTLPPEYYSVALKPLTEQKVIETAGIKKNIITLS